MSIDINELSLEDIGSWPPAVKFAAIAIVCVLIIAAAFWFDTRKQMQELDRAKAKEVQLRSTFEFKQKQAANLDAYRKQLDEIKKTFGKLLNKLPERTEVPGLLEDISKTGTATGLHFQLFDPEPEESKEFYTELPIKIVVLGNYHQLAMFVSEIASLPRIVTLHNFKIIDITKDKTKMKKLQDSGLTADDTLEMEITAKTYRYSESD